MSPVARWVAFTLVLVLIAVNFAVGRPIAVSLPHKSWDLVTPWPVQVARAYHSTQQAIETAVKVAVFVELTRQVLTGLQRMAFENFSRMIRDAWERAGGGSSERERRKRDR